MNPPPEPNSGDADEQFGVSAPSVGRRPLVKSLSAHGFGAAFNAGVIVGFVMLIAVIGWYQRPAPPPTYTVGATPVPIARTSSVAPVKAPVKVRKIIAIAPAVAAPAVPAVYPCARVMTQTQRHACVVSHLRAADRDWLATFHRR